MVKGNTASESESSDEDEVPTALTKKGALGAKPEVGLKHRVDHTGSAEKEYTSSESSDWNEEGSLSVRMNTRCINYI